MRTPPRYARPLRAFRAEDRGFTGAEKALLICFGLAVIVLVGYLVNAGTEKAGGDAKKALSAGLGASGGLGQVMTPGALPRASTVTPPPGAIGPAGAVEAPASPRPPPPAPTPLPNGQTDTAYDGAYVGAGGRAYSRDTPISQVPPVVPSDGRTPNGTIVYVNGILTTKDAQSTSLQGIADRTGSAVIGIHNATEGFGKDIAQCAMDKADIGTNPAVDQVADVTYASIMAGKPIHLIGHSQGGLILSRALTHVRQRMLIEDGLSPQEVDRRMGLIQVETFGAAAGTYPDGPQYVHYINRWDAVPDLFGKGPTSLDNFGGGRGAKYIRFNSFHWNPIASHSFDDVYLPHRIPFDQARK